MRRIPRSHPHRFNMRSVTAAGLCLLGACLGILSFAAPSSNAPQGARFRAGEAVSPREFRGDVRNLRQTITAAERKNFIRPLELDYPKPSIKQIVPGAYAGPQSLAPSVSADMASISPSAPMPTPASSFNALNFGQNGAGHPPDTVGDVGPNHFVQAVNTSIGIYNKSTGAALATFTLDTLWQNAGTGTSCDSYHGGDPTVIYDPAHDRFTQSGPTMRNIRGFQIIRRWESGRTAST